jgi:hypothetical protein
VPAAGTAWVTVLIGAPFRGRATSHRPFGPSDALRP